MIEWVLAAVYLGGVVGLTLLWAYNPAHHGLIWTALIVLWPLWLLIATLGELHKRSRRE